MENSEDITIIDIDYHRNGISGEGFYVMTFNMQDGDILRHMVGVVYPDDGGYCSVFDIDELQKDNIKFAQGNSWRGDSYESDLRRAIDEYKEKMGY